MDRLLRNEMENRFSYHRPLEGQALIYENLRGWAKGLALKILDNVPDSRERSLAITKLEECIFWANAGIARRTYQLTEHEDFNIYVNGKLEVTTNDEGEVERHIKTIPETATYAVRDREGVVIEKFFNMRLTAPGD